MPKLTKAARERVALDRLAKLAFRGQTRIRQPQSKPVDYYRQIIKPA